MNKGVVFIINLYQKTISLAFPPCCRFTPSCSEYARQAFLKYGFFTALFLAGKRVLKCHPYHRGGHDPLP
ncbi:MAG: membrane protein insertion efficiency factor YidD [Candidatus Cloacimonetes bacterium]|nr:membrane protein insertion efficiency factor YidD [Candidatus Cloacimonadota bacterium]